MSSEKSTKFNVQHKNNTVDPVYLFVYGLHRGLHLVHILEKIQTRGSIVLLDLRTGSIYISIGAASVSH